MVETPSLVAADIMWLAILRLRRRRFATGNSSQDEAAFSL